MILSIVMTLHITARFAWHDNLWNGKICRDPSGNIYCRGNYSLLSSRIQRRINLEIEEKYKEKEFCDITGGYIPPCFWCINAFGENECIIQDMHPFADLEWTKEKFEHVKPLDVEICKFSIFTWCFRLSFAEEGSPEGRYPADLEERIEKYLRYIVPGKSMVFFYLNYSNPISGDEYKRLLLGAAVVKEVAPPKKYEIPRNILENVRKGRGMQNFPEIAWFFRITLDPETAFILPYHHYLEWIDEAETDEEKDKRLKMLKEVAIPIDEPTLYPHFKYVSMHLSTDQAIYLMYLFKMSLRKMKDHRVIPCSVLNEISKKIDNNLQLLWKNRGKYPGFKAAVTSILKDRFGENSNEVAEKLERIIVSELRDLSEYFENQKTINIRDLKLKNALTILEKQKNKIEFLSRFDLSPRQMENVLEIIAENGLKTIKKNPYVLLEKYTYDQVEHWNWEESDSGIDLYNLDIALLPDLNYANWFFEEFDPKSPQRIRAIISKILLSTALIKTWGRSDQNSICIHKLRSFPWTQIL